MSTQMTTEQAVEEFIELFRIQRELARRAKESPLLRLLLGAVDAEVLSLEPTEAELRRARYYWREVDRSEAEFKAAFPHWKV